MITNDDTKACAQCGITQNVSEFLWKVRGVRRTTRCRACRAANHKENPLRARARAKHYYESNRETVSRRTRDRYVSSVGLQLLKAARGRAKKHGYRFDLTLADIFVPKTCPVLGIPLVVNVGRSAPNSPTLDRIRTSDGYVRGNVVVVSHRANTIKSDATPEELFRVAQFYAPLWEGVRLAAAAKAAQP